MSTRKKRLVIISGAIVLALTAILLVLMAMNQPTPTHAQPAGSETAQPNIPSASPPAKAAIDDVQTTLSSGSDEKIAPLIAASPGEPLQTGFSDQLKAMGLNFDYSTMKPIADSTWSIRAIDKSGKSWEVGLVRDDAGNLKILYAEATQ